MQRDPQAIARGTVTEVEHPWAGTVGTLGRPMAFRATPAAVLRAAPLLGEHTCEVLAEIGSDARVIDALIAGGAAATVS